MFLQSDAETVATILLSTEIQVFAFRGVHGCFQGGQARSGNGSRGQAKIFVAVVGVVDLQIRVKQGILGFAQQELDGGAGFQHHTDLQTLVKDAGDQGTILLPRQSRFRSKPS